MDKKRRKKTSSNHTKQNQCTLCDLTTLVYKEEKCGIVSKRFQFNEKYGIGYFDFYQFEGLIVSIFDVALTQNFAGSGSFSNNALELSFLIDGEQIIKIEGYSKDITYESQESYLVFLNPVCATIAYHKRKHLKEIKIRMDVSFLKRHGLLEAYSNLNDYTLSKTNLIQPLCTKTQDILLELICDKRKGLSKRLFLESKTLELLMLKLDTSSNTTADLQLYADNVVKKMYRVQHLVSSNLAMHYSINDLSKEIGLNDCVLKKEFKRVFKRTIFEYTNDLRMKKAKQLLLHTAKPIYEISETIGYKNATHFSAAFKKVEGITPKKYRTSSEK